MFMLDEFDAQAEAIKQVGPNARAAARAAGVPISYMDPEFGDDIIREYPDGRRERVRNGLQGPVEPIAPRR
jgi:hypothetical protein